MRTLSEQISLWFGIIMVIVVAAGGIAILTTDFLSDRLYGSKRQIFVVVLFSYAIYRGYRIYSIIKNEHGDKKKNNG